MDIEPTKLHPTRLTVDPRDVETWTRHNVDDYATWDMALQEGKVTDLHDGWPDTLMVPLVERLRAAGHVTLQSCQGHQGTDDGCLWMRPWSVDDVTEKRIRRAGDPFSIVREVWHPERRIELWWDPEDMSRAIAVIEDLLLPT